MGTWGAGSFENDAAADFAATITSPDTLKDAFAKSPDGVSQTIDAERAQVVIAAADCVAALMGHPAADLPPALAKTLANFGSADSSLTTLARESLSHVLSASELTDLWAEDDPAAFNLAMTHLIDRLNSDLPFDPSEPPAQTKVHQTCGFCDGNIAPEDLISIEIRQQTDLINSLDQGFWCHLACLNARLHPRHIVQNWKIDPDEAFRAADDLLKG